MTLSPLHRIHEILDAAKDVRVLVVGDLMLDRYVTGSVERISPEAPVQVLVVEEEHTSPGGAANVAMNVMALGARCSIVGCVGRDESGSVLRQRLSSAGIDTTGFVELPTRTTTVKTRFTAGQYQLLRVDYEVAEDMGQAAVAGLKCAIRRQRAGCAAVAIQDYDKGVVVEPVIELVRHGVAALGDVPIVADPKRRNFFDYGPVTVFKPNARELEDAIGDRLHPDDDAWMERVRRRIGCENLLLTLGAQGMALCSPDEGTYRIAASERPVFDVSGAGDTVTAMMSVALASGASVQEAAILANVAAGLSVAKAGVATVTAAEIREHLAPEGVFGVCAN